MCGISGIYDLRAPAELGMTVETMSAVVQHRGPDDHGWLTIDAAGALLTDTDAPDAQQALRRQAGTVALAQRRLSIIDLSADGHQPMSDASGRYWIVYNGEVYNYRELRAELLGRGVRFRSQTDSEVVLQSYLAWGQQCLARFNGMWAFAIYDRQDGTLFCSRDRYGVKPFYYACTAGRFAFGSEVKQLIGLPWVGARANRQVLADFFLWGLENHSDETFFAGVHSLPGSHYLLLTRRDLESGTLRPLRYWSPQAVSYRDEATAVQEFRDLLSDAVRLRLRSDVPVGVTLSGGLDSSSVVCLAGAQRRAQGESTALDAFTVEFEGKGYSERQFAELAAAQAGARSIILRPRHQDLARDWTRFIWHLEQPVGALSYFSNFQIYRLIREHNIPVVLSGQGGDELLLGYERYRAYHALFSLRAGAPRAALSELLHARRNAGLSLVKQAGMCLYILSPGLRASWRRLLGRPVLRPAFFKRYRGQVEHLARNTGFADRQELQASELFRYQLPHLLHHEDRMSMAHAVETRLPFLDYRLLDLVQGAPTDILLRDGWSKYLLRQAMRGVIPEAVRQRTDKMGYETPTGRLLRDNRVMFLPLLQRHLDDEIIDARAVLRRFDSGRLDQRLLCSALSYLTWKEEFGVA